MLIVELFVARLPLTFRGFAAVADFRDQALANIKQILIRKPTVQIFTEPRHCAKPLL
jgi:hypothetical protein